MSPALTKKGYLRVILRKEGRTHFEYVHRLVAEAYVEGDMSLYVDHIDMDKLNNHYSNLRWVTQSGNMKNRKNNVYVDFNGEKQLLIDVCRMYTDDVNIYRRVWQLIDKRLTINESLTKVGILVTLA